MAEKTKALTTLTVGAVDGFQIPVSLAKIKTTSDVTLDTASPAGNPMKQQYVDLGTGEIVERADMRRGIFRSKPNKSKRVTWGQFTEISEDDLAAIEAATAIDDFTIDDFIALKDVPRERITDAYFLAPAEGFSAKPLVLFYRALKRTKRAGVFKLVKSTRQHLAVVYAHEGGLIVNTLAFASDFATVAEAAESLERQPVALKPAEVALAVSLIEALASDAKVIDEFSDDLIPLRADLVEKALAGEKIPAAKPKLAKVPEPDDGVESRLKATEKAATKRKRAA